MIQLAVLLSRFFARHPLAVIVIAQLLGTSLWFSVNGVALNLMQSVGLTEAGLGHLTLAVQLGFISGTLLLATTGLADHFRASRLFAVSACFGALTNALFIFAVDCTSAALLLRFLTGLSLAGVYPLGMKLVISWTPQYAGTALGWLVGMLTLGIATPHLLRAMTPGLDWHVPLMLASLLAVLAAAMIYLLGEGRQLPASTGRGFPFRGLAAWRDKGFRQVSLGYFGHCWELYAFWTLVPILVTREVLRLDASPGWVSWMAFVVVASGMLGCVLGGYFSRVCGSLTIARVSLGGSGALCIFYPWIGELSPVLLLFLLVLWGILVVADSPQFSALASANAPREHLGSALAMMNSIGFALTLPSIAMAMAFWPSLQLWVIYLLLPGPLVGFWAIMVINKQTLREL